MVQNDHFDDNECVALFDIRDRTVRGTLEAVRYSFLFRDCYPSPRDSTANINSGSFQDFK